MSILTVVYGGQTIHNAEVESFSYEANARGDLFVTASTQPLEPDTDAAVDGGTGEPVPDPLNPDGRYSDTELAILRKRQATEHGKPGPGAHEGP